MDDGGEEGEVESSPLGVYEGEINSKGFRHGNGKYQFPNGDIYVGGYSEGLRSNRGVYVFKSGARYDGEWRAGVKYGRGTFLYPDGSRYEGEWRGDSKCGFGVYHYANGDIYEGTWRQDMRHGLGTYHYGTGVKFMGTWINDEIEGAGQIVYPRCRFRGNWAHNLPSGRGCFIFDNNCLQHGHYAPKEAVTDDGLPEAAAVRLPVWHARSVTQYSTDLLPPEATPLHEEIVVPSVTECSELSDGSVGIPPCPSVENEFTDNYGEFGGEG